MIRTPMLPLGCGMIEPASSSTPPDPAPTAIPEATPPPNLHQTSRLERFFGGLQAATLAALITLPCFAMAAYWTGRSPWTVPNLISGVFFGMPALRREFSYQTVVGSAFHAFLCLLFGVIFSQVVPPNLRRRTSVLLGVLASTSWFYLLDGFFWRRAFPPYALFSKRPSIFLSFVLLGICVGLYSVFVRSFVERQNSV